MNRVKKRILCFADERGNQNTDYTHADVGENRKPNRSITCRSEDENYYLYNDCKYKIEMNNVYCSLEKVVSRCELVEPVVRENDIGRFTCRLSAETHCNACVRGSKNGSIVNSVADVNDLAILVLDFLKVAELFFGKKIAIVFIKIDGFCNLVGCRFVVAGKHYNVFNALITQMLDHVLNALSERTSEGDRADDFAVKNNANVAVRVVGSFDTLRLKQAPAAA